MASCTDTTRSSGWRLKAASASVVLAIVAVGMTACSALGQPSPSMPYPHLGITNDTSIGVMLWVNGNQVRSVEPRTQATIPVSELPTMPWSVDTKSPSGEVW